MAYEKDLLMRMLTVFLQKLAEKLSNTSILEITDLEMENFFSTALNRKREFIIHLDEKSLIGECMVENRFSIEKCRVLAELLYVEAFRAKEDVNMELAKKSLSLFKHYTRKTKTFDFGMVEKINQLTRLLHHE